MFTATAAFGVAFGVGMVDASLIVPGCSVDDAFFTAAVAVVLAAAVAVPFGAVVAVLAAAFTAVCSFATSGFVAGFAAVTAGFAVAFATVLATVALAAFVAAFFAVVATVAFDGVFTAPAALATVVAFFTAAGTATFGAFNFSLSVRLSLTPARLVIDATLLPPLSAALVAALTLPDETALATFAPVFAALTPFCAVLISCDAVDAAPAVLAAAVSPTAPASAPPVAMTAAPVPSILTAPGKSPQSTRAFEMRASLAR